MAQGRRGFSTSEYSEIGCIIAHDPARMLTAQALLRTAKSNPQ